jgi:hypothetical protein
MPFGGVQLRDTVVLARMRRHGPKPALATLTADAEWDAILNAPFNEIDAETTHPLWRKGKKMKPLTSAMQKLTTGEVGAKIAKILSGVPAKDRAKVLKLAAIERELALRKEAEKNSP